MKTSRKAARQRLRDATRAEYTVLVQEANLTPIQRKILEMHLCRGNSVVKAAMELNCCEATVRKRLAEAYDKVAKV